MSPLSVAAASVKVWLLVDALSMSSVPATPSPTPLPARSAAPIAVILAASSVVRPSIIVPIPSSRPPPTPSKSAVTNTVLLVFKPATSASPSVSALTRARVTLSGARRMMLPSSVLMIAGSLITRAALAFPFCRVPALKFSPALRVTVPVPTAETVPVVCRMSPPASSSTLPLPPVVVRLALICRSPSAVLKTPAIVLAVP